MAKKNNNKISIFEIVWYSLTGAVALWGLTFIILGVVSRNLPSSAGLYKGDAAYKAAMNLGFFDSGLIIFSSAVVLAIIVLLITAKKSDREVEKQQRRAARVASASNVQAEQKTNE